MSALTKVLKEPNFQGIAANSLASARVFNRGNIVNLYLRCLTGAGAELTRAQILADVSNIRVKLDGVQVVSVDARFLLDRQKYLGDSIGDGNQDGIIRIPFELPHIPFPQGRRASAMGTADLDTISVEVDVIGVAQLATIELYTEMDKEANKPLGDHVRLEKYNRNFSSTGDFEISDLPYKDRNLKGYLAAHIYTTAGVLASVEVKKDGEIVLDQVPMELNKVQNAYAKRTDQTNYQHIDFGRGMGLDSFLATKGATSLLWVTNWSTSPAGNFSIFLERIYSGLKG